MRIPPPPPGYEAFERSGAVGFARPAALPVIRQELGRHATLHAASLTWSDPIPLAGRGHLVAARPPTRGPTAPPRPHVDDAQPVEAGRWVVRPYRRGGLMAPLLGDRHLSLGPPRPWVEAHAAAAVTEAGIDTPPIVAGVVYPGWPWYRAELVTAYVAGTRDLASVLFGPERSRDGAVRCALLSAAARITRALAAAGVVHPDLNAKNLLVPWAGTGPARVQAGLPGLHVIDLDRARTGPAGPAQAHAMATRLARSLDKFGDRSGPPLAEGEWAAFRGPPPADAPPTP